MSKAPGSKAPKSKSKQRVGFIGVGLMGHGMAKNIVEKGYPLAILGHRNRKPVDDLVKRGATKAKSPAELAKSCDVIFLCVTSSLQVEDLIRRADGIKAGAHEGLIVVDCSTADPNSTIALARELAPLGVRLIDAPLGRSPKEAELGLLNTFVGADDETLKEIRPLIETWAENIIHVGPVGAGHKMKIINNFVAMSYVAVYAEAFTAAKKTGVPLEKFRGDLLRRPQQRHVPERLQVGHRRRPEGARVHHRQLRQGHPLLQPVGRRREAHDDGGQRRQADLHHGAGDGPRRAQHADALRRRRQLQRRDPAARTEGGKGEEGEEERKEEVAICAVARLALRDGPAGPPQGEAPF
jgi:3-hydroxyisobutyrate dehydrogenase-like beta-hydroxyacid dehydrogenase